MKVLYIAHFKNGSSGWSRAALDYLLAMDSVSIDVVPRTVVLSDTTPDLPDRFYELESKSSTGCDIVIQHVLPHHLQYDGNFKKNIALCVYESGGTWLHNWSSKINSMDELWVPSTFTQECFKEGGVTVPIKIAPHTFDLPLKSTKEKLDIPEHRGNYIFYTIADLNVRKNLPAIIQAFHREFTINEPVSLFMKVSKFGLHPSQTLDILNKDCSQIKEHMKLYTNCNLYKDEYIVTDNLSRDDLIKFHNTGNCYVNASHGEAWCIPMFEAMALGKQIICPSKMYDYSQGISTDVPTIRSMNLRCNESFKAIGSARETWMNVSPVHLGEAMRNVYNQFKNKEYDASRGINRANAYSYSSVGKIIRRLLHGK